MVKHNNGKRRSKGRGRSAGGIDRHCGKAYPVALRLRVVEAVSQGASLREAHQVFGPSAQTIQGWVEAYNAGGLEALTPHPVVPPKRSPRPGEEVRRAAVVSTKQEHPHWGTRRIRDMLARFEALGVSEADAAERVAELVRRSRGLLGAAALSRSVRGISRRHATRVKVETLTAIERERKLESARFSVHFPGVIRGFDGMSLTLGGDKAWILAAGMPPCPSARAYSSLKPTTA